MTMPLCESFHDGFSDCPKILRKSKVVSRNHYSWRNDNRVSCLVSYEDYASIVNLIDRVEPRRDSIMREVRGGWVDCPTLGVMDGFPRRMR